jgi:N-acetylmuramoyl-L-alanine amidase/Mannosyl-glycoprotein endo-beta-N-acetylglucosaminidase
MPQDDRLDVYLAVGHGVEPSGVFDPGAIGKDGRQEHLEAFQVCTHALAGMRRSGLRVVSESAQGASHDPDFRGSAMRANQLGPRVAIEVHFDFAGGVDGFSGLYVSDNGKALAKHIGDAFHARHQPRAADVRRTDLFFLNATSMTALIPEIRRVADYPSAVNEAQGEAIAEGTCAFLGHTYIPPAGPKPRPDDVSVTPDSPLHAAPRAPRERARQYLLARPHGEYSDNDVRVIVDHYYTTAAAVGLDPLLVVAQMAEETGHLTSFWSQRPRRNLAGIGVTGEPGVGLSFPDLKTAVRAHTGRLLAYSLPSGTGSQAQNQLIAEALAFRPLPEKFRGVAPTLKGLAGTYAADPQYAVKLARVANEIRTTGA